MLERDKTFKDTVSLVNLTATPGDIVFALPSDWCIKLEAHNFLPLSLKSSVSSL